MGGRQRWSSTSWKQRFQYGRNTYSRNASGRKIMCANCVLQNRRSETNQHSGRQTMDNITVIHKFEEAGLKGASCAQLVSCIFASPKRGCTAVVQKLETKVLTKRKHTFEQRGRRERHRRTLSCRTARPTYAAQLSSKSWKQMCYSRRSTHWRRVDGRNTR